MISRAIGIAVGPARKQDPRPLHPQPPGVGLAVGGVVQHGEHVVEQVLHSRAQVVKVALGCWRQVGTALRSSAIEFQAVVTEPCGEPKGSSLN